MKPDMRNLLPKLREIGFGIWDPLGLAETREEGAAMADEYDSHPIGAFSAAAKARDLEAVCAVLRQAEIRTGLENPGPAGRRGRAARALLRLACGPGPE